MSSSDNNLNKIKFCTVLKNNVTYLYILLTSTPVISNTLNLLSVYKSTSFSAELNPNLESFRVPSILRETINSHDQVPKKSRKRKTGAISPDPRNNVSSQKRFKETRHINIAETKAFRRNVLASPDFRSTRSNCTEHDKSIAGRLNALPRATLFSFLATFPFFQRPLQLVSTQRETEINFFFARRRSQEIFQGNSPGKIARPLPPSHSRLSPLLPLPGWSLYRGYYANNYSADTGILSARPEEQIFVPLAALGPCGSVYRRRR